MHYSLGFSLFSLCILAGCGDSPKSILPPESKSDDHHQYLLNVTTSGDFDTVGLQWMGHNETLSAEQDYQFTQAGKQFKAPDIKVSSIAIQCDSEIKESEKHTYELTVNCVTSQVKVHADIGPAYGLDIRYGDMVLPFNSEAIVFDYQPGVAPSIEHLQGPQTCTLAEKKPGLEYQLVCEGLTVGLLGKKLAISRDNQESQIVWENTNKRLIRQGYEWFDEGVWFTSWDDNVHTVHKLAFENGQPTEVVDFGFDAYTVKAHTGKLYALSSPVGGDDNQIAQFVNGQWETVGMYDDMKISGGFSQNNDNLYFNLNKDEGGHALGQIKGSEYVYPKVISEQIDVPSLLPAFNYDGRNFFAGYSQQGNLLVNYLDTVLPYRHEAVFEYENVGDVTLWEDSQQNQYLFYLQNNQVKQFNVKINDVEGTVAFDLDELNTEPVNWLGGDLTTLLVGSANEGDEFGRLRYIKSGDVAVNHAGLKARLATDKDIYVVLPNWRNQDFYFPQNHSKVSTQAAAHGGYLLGYVGDTSGTNATGELWLLSAHDAHKVFSGVLWHGYLGNEYYIDAVSELHVVVQGAGGEMMAISIDSQ
ncbi:hypothetical protein L1285_13095 [Pseudoalteromonas sp. DL2-H2.2]|uniref:hypothetical protein n=1 Tax=Pseudoalteromonas sp. DL2-H2.2 TaxID=2908889 RepID=UPI001F32691E|nr:hypothetical protein [Pseudoalteromonas sp. DL2-H2.2]MCF2909258.1 hypothetical protein [Pseudoalteromonas sp. DL2-H2.2]